MSSKQMKFDAAAQAEFKQGVDQIASAVAVTIGPSGHNVVMEKSYGGPAVTKDGVSVAKEVDLIAVPIRQAGPAAHAHALHVA